jgi:hypothetical protein
MRKSLAGSHRDYKGALIKIVDGNVELVAGDRVITDEASQKEKDRWENIAVEGAAFDENGYLPAQATYYRHISKIHVQVPVTWDGAKTSREGYEVFNLNPRTSEIEHLENKLAELRNETSEVLSQMHDVVNNILGPIPSDTADDEDNDEEE